MSYPKIEICSPDGKAMYVTLDGYIFYIDNTSNEQIMECWKDVGSDGMYWRKEGFRTDISGKVLEKQ